MGLWGKTCGEILEIQYEGVEENQTYNTLLKMVLETCFQTENLDKNKIYVNIILTTPTEIQKYNKTYRNIDKPTDVLSFPMFEKEELKSYLENNNNMLEVLGDIIISIDRVKEQAKEYGHSFERELAYMAVHGFYHLMGYDHMEEEEKKQMRQKEEVILEKIGLTIK